MKRYIEVKFIKPCPGYAYFPGDFGKVRLNKLYFLLKGGFIKGACHANTIEIY